MYVGRMKLTRNKIRKIRKQQHQSVRKWKKARKSPRRRAVTFRRSRAPMAEMVNSSSSSSVSSSELPLKLKNIFNKTLKRYIPLPVLHYLKDKYDNMKRMRRKQRRAKMIGGGKDDVVVAAAAAAAAAASAASASAASAAAAKSTILTDNNTDNATVNAIATDNDKNKETANDTTDNDKDATDKNKETAKDTTDNDKDKETAKDTAKDTTDNDKDATATDGAKKNSNNLGRDIPGDISIHSETFVLEKNEDAQKLLTFLVNNGLPYYIQLELKDDGKKFNKHDTDIFDLRRILCGKFATEKDFKTEGKIDDNKLDLYFKAPDQIGIADGDTMGNEYPDDVFIYTGEKGMVDRGSTDKSIKIAITGNENNLITVVDSRRLYKLLEDGPKTIDNFEMVLAFGEKVDPSEFRLQVAPISDDDFKKAAAIEASSDGAKKKGKKVVVDDTNSYVVNLSAGCKVTSIQTLRKTLEIVRVNLEEDDEDISKTKAMGVFKMLLEILNNPELAKNEGFDDFIKSVGDFTYKIPGLERRYGFTQLAIFFTQKKDDVPPDLVKIFGQLLTLLGKGPMGENGACAAFDTPGLPLKFETLVTPMADGKVKEVTRLTNKGNITSIEGILEGLQGASAKAEGTDEAKKEGAEGAKKEGADEAKKEGADEAKKEGAEGAEGDAAKAEGDAVKVEGAKDGDEAKDDAAVKAEGEEAKGAEAETEAATAAATANTNTRPLTKEDIEEIDAIDSFGLRYKAYLIRRFKFKDEPDVNMVHFMGWGTETDEFISATEEQKRILPRDEKSKTGQGQLDKTIDDVMKLYKNVDMTKMESKAMEKSAEMKERNAPAAPAASAPAAPAAAAAAAAAASAAAAQR